MESNNIKYDFNKSLVRIDDILNASNTSFEDKKEIPSRDSLTYTNWYYVSCTAIFVDIRGSSNLPNSHTKPVLAKIYRAYISEIVALLNSYSNCKEINIHWDSIWWIFNTPKKIDIDEVFSLSAQISSLIDILNYKLEKKNYKTISIWIWIDDWDALMIKSWYNWSWINDVVWMWDVVNKASKLCWYWNKIYWDSELMVSEVIYNNLNEKNKELLKWNSNRSCYNWNIVNVEMNKWLESKKEFNKIYLIN